ncbi:DUF63 family protein [Halorubellus sp. JP-L1]|uniref:DUF63 family protein n=1 Tax=Halorubellus sp. JP-L1 TaxID=2715753 RepID=UPI00140DBBCF|nr:DUF63 family protein [Halorubellus sp. JP-L1]
MGQAWAVAVGALLAVFGLGSIVFPRTVYANFVWHYFWGPVYADAHGWSYAAWADGEQVRVSSSDVASGMGPVAEPGYTIYSEVGYAVILIVMLVGVALLLRRLDIERYRRLFYALFPFVPLGGALRVLEDANNVLPAEASAFALDYPANTLFISPLIYFTMFFLTLAALLVALWVHRNGYADTYEYPLAAMGTAMLAATLAAIFALAFTTEGLSPPRLEFYPIITVLTLTFATVATGGTWALLERFAPEVNEGTGYIGLVIIWGQSVDGVSNVIGLDWYDELVPVATADLDPKHPVNKFVQDFTGQVLPESITAVTGDAWTFLLVKLVAAVFVVWVFDEEIFEESPRFTFMLLLAILAVGLGPGTRDMLRATFLV